MRAREHVTQANAQELCNDISVYTSVSSIASARCIWMCALREVGKDESTGLPLTFAQRHLPWRQTEYKHTHKDGAVVVPSYDG